MMFFLKSSKPMWGHTSAVGLLLFQKKIRNRIWNELRYFEESDCTEKLIYQANEAMSYDQTTIYNVIQCYGLNISS